MSRPKGSKNKPQQEETSEQLQDLPEDSELLGETKEDNKKLLGYHPITGAEVWH